PTSPLFPYTTLFRSEVARTRFGDELEPVAPAHARASADHVDHALDRAVMVCAGLRPGMDDNRPGPELLRAGARVRDRRGAEKLRSEEHTSELQSRFD